jgi:hypothetical protein
LLIEKRPLQVHEGAFKRIFKVVVWVGNNPGLRLTLEASNADEVTEYLHEKYGPEIVSMIWYEGDAHKLR